MLLYLLVAHDNDSSPEELLYYIGQVYGGYLSHIHSTGIKIANFSQSDIDDEKIMFIHDANARMNRFTFILSDGLFNSTEQTVFIKVKDVNLFKINNEIFRIFPMTKQPIYEEHLLYTCSDESQMVWYKITVPPHLGRILFELNGQTTEIVEFNQDDINNGRIFYEHVISMPKLKTNDSFVFDVNVNSVSHLIDQNFIIEISVSSRGILQFINCPEINVDEGGLAPINMDFSKLLEFLISRAGIISPVLYIEINNPLYGHIEFSNRTLKNKEKLTHIDFESGNIYYVHDNSDTLGDEITVSVFLLPQ